MTEVDGAKLAAENEAAKDLQDVVPASARSHWINSASIFAGCDVCIPIIFVGAKLANGLVFQDILIAFLIWGLVSTVFSAINCTIGVDTGRAGANICRCAFGSAVSRILISLILIYMCMGWYGMHVDVAARAFLSFVHVDYAMESNFAIYALTMVVIGILFVIPAIYGAKLMSKMSKVMLPVIFLVFFWAIYLTFVKAGGVSAAFSQITHYTPTAPMTLTAALVMMLGGAACKFVMGADYSRTCNNLLPAPTFCTFFGNIPVLAFLYLIGAFMTIITGNWDIVYIMNTDLGMPVWGLLCVFLAQLTTMMLAAYSNGLALNNMFNIKSKRGILFSTVLGAVIGTLLAVFGIMDQIDKFLGSIGILYPPVGMVMAVDHYLVRRRKWTDNKGVNWAALVSVVGAAAIGFAVSTLGYGGFTIFTTMFLAGVSYYIWMRVQAKVKPNSFTPEHWRNGDFELSPAENFFRACYFVGVGLCAVPPFFVPDQAGCWLTFIGSAIVMFGFCMMVKDQAILGGYKTGREPAWYRRQQTAA